MSAHIGILHLVLMRLLILKFQCSLQTSSSVARKESITIDDPREEIKDCEGENN